MLLSDPLLATKIHVPLARPQLVARPRLLAKLNEGLRMSAPLTLVSAPAGFGKTTLVSQWFAALDVPSAWLTMDGSDNDARIFLRYLFAAVGRVHPRFEEWRGSVEIIDCEPLAALTAFVNELSIRKIPLVLALDDYHAINQPAVHELLALILATGLPEFHVVVITREDPPLPLARMRARGQINEIRERDLRFELAESADFFSQTMNLHLSAQAVATLDARTEGWVTALQLAGVAMRQQGVTDSFISTFTGNDRYIVDYVMHEALANEPDSLRQFLRQTAILDRFSAALCDAVTERSDAQAMLDHLDKANLFLIPLDNRREWYRYHSLFAEVLRLALDEDDQSQLHDRAAAWCAAAGLTDMAAAHQHMSASLRKAGANAQKVDQTLVEPLSQRELEILSLIRDGDSNAEIARKLFITIGTVKRHINNIFGKLGVHSRGKAISRARELALL